ncbi:hypothetical protein [Aliarcobacter cryaerophilus]|nr:hypothetical protein [Aliarcobacter cryaerophilus]MCT7405234.1 hypothetical protein [Aliarcobacter cryaerophilus]MCT7431761.1 hypothetical protein [Aliarcobacter cryaerophilus]MCT7502725.1 hypothetical protein [Aliarcobacter cryaerophilus]
MNFKYLAILFVILLSFSACDNKEEEEKETESQKINRLSDQK